MTDITSKGLFMVRWDVNDVQVDGEDGDQDDQDDDDDKDDDDGDDVAL